MNRRIETVWRLIPLHNQPQYIVDDMVSRMKQFCSEVSFFPATFQTFGGFGTETIDDEWHLTTTSYEDEGMIRLYCGANYDLEMLSQSVSYST